MTGHPGIDRIAFRCDEAPILVERARGGTANTTREFDRDHGPHTWAPVDDQADAYPARG